MKILRPAVTLFLWAASAAAQPWTPSECTKPYAKNWAAFAQAMKEAEPGAPLYAPRPFPRTSTEVIEDFRYAYLHQMWKGVGEEGVPEHEHAFYRAVQSGRMDIRIERVENWTPLRCLEEKQDDYYFLIYVRDLETSRELGRFLLSQNGLAAGWAITPDESHPGAAIFSRGIAPPLDEALRHARSRFGIRGTRAQYVTTQGTLHCAIVAPCVAFQAGEKVYLLHPLDDLFELGPSSRAYPHAAINKRNGIQQIQQGLDSKQERLVSLGADRWVIVRKVASSTSD